ncbi:MAG: quercetin 2,3-dioxygenase [Solirubrobacteraceae bacterium]|jgi:redox-sensitive bicupin YhaK (pirin superfamily)|nr:quercetin 2,3-dioxygenase [Solirubrobacteraceae bacterium]
MTASHTTVSRSPALVQDAVHNGRTAQSDDMHFIVPPDEQRWDPFLILVDDWFSDVGFPWHPHRGFQTLTFVLDGRLEHRDNAGGHGVLGAGDAQYMAAGRYALHSELAHERRPVHTLQLWLNLPPEKKLVETSYVDLRRDAAALIAEEGVEARLHVGRVREHRGADPETFHVPFSLIEIHLDAGARFVHEVPGRHAAVVHVVSGDVRLGGDRRPAGDKQMAWFPAGEPGTSEIAIEAETDSHLVVYSAAPIGAPVVFGGPFVMNTREEVEQAFAEYRAGMFGPIPADEPPAR